jgi:NACalpha-BTF3-like transcription factor
VTIPNADDIKMKEKEQELKQLDEIRRVMVHKFDQTRTIISNTQKNLRVLQSSKATSGTSLKTKLLKVLKKFGVEKSSYHGSSLNGKDIKKVMNTPRY